MYAQRSHAIARTLSVAAVVVGTALVLGHAPASFADEPAAPTPPSAAGMTEFVLPEEVLTSEILKNLARVTGSAITWSDQDKAVNVKKLKGSGTTLRGSVEQIFDAVRAMLANEEIVLMRYGPPEGKMILAMDARTLASQFIIKAQPEVIDVTDEMVPKLMSQGGRFVSATIRVTNLTELRDVRTALQRVITQNNVGSVQEVPAARALVVTDFAPNVALVYRMIRAMDVPPAPTAEAKKTTPAYFVLKHASAQRVAILLRDLFFAKPPAPSASATQPGIAPPAPADASPRISYDDASNQLVVIATTEDVATMKEIVQHVDVDPTVK